MGVPKFYRWISERYPCLSEVIREHQIPDFDNLYLDMNGIIHTCSHPNDDDPHFRISEEKIFAGICHYLDFLFKMIKPKKVFFMAIDGVAPRAKMNQQRGRRFRTAKTAVVLEERAKALGEDLPSEARFDSNCITPGTEFMARLHSILQEFVVHKISTDRLWKNVRVYLSGHETPGEGEHKIMDFIRYEKSQPGYDPNTRHCLYGLDADLIMLGLCSHELYFSLLREEVKFGGKKTQKRIMSPEETTFHLLHISLLRDYLYHEFSPVKDKLPFEFSVENVVDDFVLMSFLVGNDFIPHLPQLHIHHDALPVLFRTYMDVLPRLDGYINEQGTLNLSRFETFLHKLSEYDFHKFEELNDDFQYLNDKSQSRSNNNNNNNNNNNEEEDVKKDNESDNRNSSDILLGLGFSSMTINKMAEFDSDVEEDEEEDEKEDDSDECDSLDLQLFNMHKTDYYMSKLEFSEVTPEIMKDQAEGYVRAIQWNLHYYYNGVVSWSWYYPHHYSPYISDVKDFKNMEMKFELGKPFLPFQQLLAVLPKLSKDLLPEPYQKLMCDADSPLADFYPDDFETDLNGKQQEWEAIVLIPFINEKLLLKFANMADKELSDEERKRNSHGPHLLYTYNEKSHGMRQSFLQGYYPAINDTHFKVQTIDPDFFRLPAHQIVKGLAKEAVLDQVILGFPTLRTIEHTAELRNENVKVFQMLSQRDNMMLTLKEHEENNLQKVAEEIVGKVIHVGWPHLREAFVVAVSDGSSQVLYDKSKSLTNKPVLMKREMNDDERDIFGKQVESVKEHNYQRWGIFVGKVNILVHAKCLSGLRMAWTKEGRLTEEKQWEGNLCNFALQMTLSNINAFCPDLSGNFDADILSPGSVVFSLTHPYYGNMGTIELENHDRSVLVELEVVNDPDLTYVIQNRDRFVSEEYMLNYVAAQQLGVEPYFVSHLTGVILLQTSPKGSGNPNRVNVGLNLKSNRRNEETVGFTRKAENGKWLYSKKVVKLLDAYLKEFSDFLELLFKYVKKDVVYLEDLYPDGDRNEVINNVVKWLKSQESASAERQKCGTKRLDSGIVKEIERTVSLYKQSPQYIKKKYLPQQLFSPFMCKGITKPDPTAQFNLFDRVISVSQSTCVPLGLKGTIIGMSAEENDSDTVYEIVFDKEFFGGLALSCSPGKGYRLPAHSLINISHGLRLQQKHQSPARTSRAVFNKAAASDAILKHLQSDNMVSAVQFLQRKQHPSPQASNKPFYNVNEMFQTSSIQDASPQSLVFPSNLSDASKQFVTPKAGVVAGSFPGKVLPKKNSTPSPSQANYQDLWAELKKGKPESPMPKNQSDRMYGQKLSVKELFQSVENQKETNTKHAQILPSESSSEHFLKKSQTPFVDVLLKLCIERFNQPPTYSYQNYGNTHLYIACISLHNGMKVTGVPREQKHEAAASAAEKAITVLTSQNRKDLHGAPIQSNHGMYNTPPCQPLLLPGSFPGHILVKNSPFPPQPALYPPAFESQPLMRHPSPMHSNRIPDSFVASNQMLYNNQLPQPPPAVVSQHSSPSVSDPELFYIPGGGTARIKRQQAVMPSSAGGDSSNLFVPNQVLKQQAVKAPFDSSGVSNADWPDLPSRNNITCQSGGSSSSANKVVSSDSQQSERRTMNISDILKTQQDSYPSEKTVLTPHASSMTVLSKKQPSRRRIAANFMNP